MSHQVIVNFCPRARHQSIFDFLLLSLFCLFTVVSYSCSLPSRQPAISSLSLTPARLYSKKDMEYGKLVLFMFSQSLLRFLLLARVRLFIRSTHKVPHSVVCWVGAGCWEQRTTNDILKFSFVRKWENGWLGCVVMWRYASNDDRADEGHDAEKCGQTWTEKKSSFANDLALVKTESKAW